MELIEDPAKIPPETTTAPTSAPATAP